MSLRMVKAYYEGVLYEKCVKDWVRFLRNKGKKSRCPQTVMKYLNQMDELGLTPEQCLGIERMPQKRKVKQENSVPIVHKREIKQYQQVNKYLSRGLMPQRGV